MLNKRRKKHCEEMKKKPLPCHLLLVFGLVQHIYASPKSIQPD